MSWDDRRPSSPRDMAIASLSGIVPRHVSKMADIGNPSPEEIEAALAELREHAGAHPEWPVLDPSVLAERCGVKLGAAFQAYGYPPDAGVYGEWQWKLALAECTVLLAAGADESQIARWVSEGMRRIAAVTRPVPQYPWKPAS